ncbi:MAG: NAD(P)-dependent oxidoreductase [Rhodospirillales bacterium]
MIDQRLADTPIAFIGLGLMGKPMARNLHDAGAAVTVASRSPGPVEEFAALGLSTAGTPAEAAMITGAGIVILMLPDTPTVETVIAGEGGVLAGLSPGTLVIDMGTTDALVTRELADKVGAAGGAYIDAPVSGGQIGAETGELVIMAGGSEADIARAMPFFNVLGKQTTRVGDVGAGQVAKACNQIIVGLNIGAVAEALALAEAAGVDPAKVRQALKGGFADSRILEVHGQRMIDRTFQPGGKVTTQRKDLDQGLALGKAFGLDLPATALCRDLYDRLIEAGDGGLDHSGLIKAIDPDWGG